MCRATENWYLSTFNFQVECYRIFLSEDIMAFTNWLWLTSHLTWYQLQFYFKGCIAHGVSAEWSLCYRPLHGLTLAENLWGGPCYGSVTQGEEWRLRAWGHTAVTQLVGGGTKVWFQSSSYYSHGAAEGTTAVERTLNWGWEAWVLALTVDSNVTLGIPIRGNEGLEQMLPRLCRAPDSVI